MAAPALEEALQRRDFAAAQAVFASTPGLAKEASDQWHAWLLFHAGRAEEALEAYGAAAEAAAAAISAGGGKSYDLHRAACLFQLRRYRQAQELAQQGPDCPLKTRLLLHCAAKLDEAASAAPTSGAAPTSSCSGDWEAQLGAGGVEDQLSVAAALYARADFAGAAALYEGLLARFPDLHALRAYLALCAYMQDDYEGSAAHIEAYQAVQPDSLLAANLRACCDFRAGDAATALHTLGGLPPELVAPPAAEAGVGQLAAEQGCGPQAAGAALIRHNAVVFGDGQGGLQVLPPLVGVVEEARLNLVLLYCKRGDPARALGLLRGMEPGTALEFICQAVACALHGQAAGSGEHIQRARESFLAVGSSPTELDTVPGRQCMASALLLGSQPQEALPYLESVAEVCEGDDALSWNLGLARGAAGQWEAAAQALQAVQRRDWLEDSLYQSWLVRCLVRCGQPEAAWQVYLQAQAHAGAAPAVAALLGLLGSELFQAGAFLWAARAFHALEHVQRQQALLHGGALAASAPAAAAAAAAAWEGKRAASMAAF
ncbi:hypothetical protein ABPG75_011599 [Micractinium tetrahymenae]